MEFADLARWTPVRLDFAGNTPMVDWADLSTERFSEPFFAQTVARWASGPRARPLIRTGLDALVALDNEPSLEPTGMVFHLSRCGSTLVSRLLHTLPGVVVLSEPPPLNALLGLDPDQVNEAELVRAVRLLVRALGRRRHDDESQLVLKCTSWNIRRREVLAAAFPASPWVWVQREPAHVLASLLAEPPGWLKFEADPARSARRFGLDPNAIAAMTPPEFAARALGSMLEAAAATQDPQRRLCVDYDALPAAVWQQIAPHFGLHVDAPAIEQMTEQSQFYSKDQVPRLFSGDDPQRRPTTDAMRQVAARFADPFYRELSRGR